VVRAWVGQPKLDAVLRPKLAGGDELGAEPQDAPGEALQNVGEKAYGFNRRLYSLRRGWGYRLQSGAVVSRPEHVVRLGLRAGRPQEAWAELRGVKLPALAVEQLTGLGTSLLLPLIKFKDL